MVTDSTVLQARAASESLMPDIANLVTSHVDRLSFVSGSLSERIQRRLHEDEVKICKVRSRLQVCGCRWTTDAVGGRAGRWLSEKKAYRKEGRLVACPKSELHVPYTFPGELCGLARRKKQFYWQQVVKALSVMQSEGRVNVFTGVEVTVRHKKNFPSLERLSQVERWRLVPSRGSFPGTECVHVRGWQRRFVKKRKGGTAKCELLSGCEKEDRTGRLEWAMRRDMAEGVERDGEGEMDGEQQ